MTDWLLEIHTPDNLMEMLFCSPCVKRVVIEVAVPFLSSQPSLAALLGPISLTRHFLPTEMLLTGWNFLFECRCFS